VTAAGGGDGHRRERSQRTGRQQSDRYRGGVEVAPERFEDLVADALDAIPPELAALMDNVVVVVVDRSPSGGLLGLYEGVPLTERSSGYGDLSLPDRITIYRQAICDICGDEDEVVRQVTITVVHEVAHHFGIDDDRLVELGWD
jgi:predicted Zn-dependent protease with MMP-like domain